MVWYGDIRFAKISIMPTRILISLIRSCLISVMLDSRLIVSLIKMHIGSEVDCCIKS